MTTLPVINDNTPSETNPLTGWHYAKPIEYLGTSDLTSASRCMRQFFYRKVCNLVPSGGDSIALKFGEAIHRGLSAMILTGDLEAAMKLFDSVWLNRMPDEKRSRETAVKIFLDISDTVGPDAANPPYKLLEPPRGTLAVTDKYSDYEIPFTLYLPGTRIPIKSRIDGWCRDSIEDALWALEYKTTSSLSAFALNSFDINVQSMLYTLVLRILGNQVAGCMFHHLLVSKTQQGNVTKPLLIPEFQLDSFVKWLTYLVLKIQHAEETKTFPQEWSGCYGYAMFGTPTFPCQYQNMCLVEDWTRLAAMYEQSSYKPFTEIPPNATPEEIKALEIAAAATPDKVKIEVTKKQTGGALIKLG